MLRATEMVAIVGTSLALTSGVMWTRSVTAGPATQAQVRVVLQPDESAQRPVRVVHPGYVRRALDEADAGHQGGADAPRWVDPYRIRKVVER